MYYTLRATRAEAFEFEYLEHGPEVWRVRVVRRKVDPETDGRGAAGAGGGYPAE
jgi:uncharacterized protein (DUF2249 family)